MIGKIASAGESEGDWMRCGVSATYVLCWVGGVSIFEDAVSVNERRGETCVRTVAAFREMLFVHVVAQAFVLETDLENRLVVSHCCPGFWWSCVAPHSGGLRN